MSLADNFQVVVLLLLLLLLLQPDIFRLPGMGVPLSR